jgi:hypothetical protein
MLAAPQFDFSTVDKFHTTIPDAVINVYPALNEQERKLRTQVAKLLSDIPTGKESPMMILSLSLREVNHLIAPIVSNYSITPDEIIEPDSIEIISDRIVRYLKWLIPSTVKIHLIHVAALLKLIDNIYFNYSIPFHMNPITAPDGDDDDTKGFIYPDDMPQPWMEKYCPMLNYTYLVKERWEIAYSANDIQNVRPPKNNIIRREKQRLFNRDKLKYAMLYSKY